MGLNFLLPLKKLTGIQNSFIFLNFCDSLFFLILNVKQRLDGVHVVFGYVVEGLDVLKKIEVSSFVAFLL